MSARVMAHGVVALLIGALVFGAFVLGRHHDDLLAREHRMAEAHVDRAVQAAERTAEVADRAVQAAVRTAQAADRAEAAAVLAIDAVTSADQLVVEDRTDSLRCAILYLADTLGKRRQLSSGQWGLRGAPAGSSWEGWPANWERCSVCAAGYECHSMQRRGQR